jgi:DNA-binding MarR family transcriptional regulator
MSITCLAGLAEFKRSTVAYNLRVLEKAGLIALRAADDDRRVTWILLTWEGQRVFANGVPAGQSARCSMRVGVVGGRMKIVRDEMMADVAIASAGHFKAEASRGSCRNLS